MSPRRRITDGFTVIERLDLEGEDGAGGLDWMIREPEAGWKKIAERYPVSPGPNPDPLSLGSYAREILSALRHVRSLHVQDPAREEALIAGLRAGGLITRAFWTFHRGQMTRAGKRRRLQQKRAGRISARKRGARIRAAVQAHAETLRRKHPHSREHSTRWLAREIARKIRHPFGTVRDTLSKLQRR